ncbi:MAG: alpha/beta hydrolase [Planctomycetota bacterium]
MTREAIIRFATALLVLASFNVQQVIGQEDSDSLERIEFSDLPELVAKRARKEFPADRLIGVERSNEKGQLLYHVMFEVEGAEAGVAIKPDGNIRDRWHFKGDSVPPIGDSVPPTHENIQYGPHQRNMMDLWIAESRQATPLLICIHGGGFSDGDKSGFRHESELFGQMLEAGISVAAINYRLTEDGKHPFPIPMMDGVRAVQYLRLHAEKFNLDKDRFGATGGSAGGCMLMWIGFHPDFAMQEHVDPIRRESSRLQVLAPFGGQSCLHLPTLEGWFGVSPLPVHPAYFPLFKLSEESELRTKSSLESMLAASPTTYLTRDDPPIYLAYGDSASIDDELTPDRWVHHPVMGIKLKESMDKLGIECHVEYEGNHPVSRYKSQVDFVIRKLTETDKLPR